MKMQDIQARHKEWVARNFGDREPVLHAEMINDGATLVCLLGDVSRSILKADQGIRGTIDDHKQAASATMIPRVNPAETIVSHHLI
jgi:hypothetical protein